MDSRTAAVSAIGFRDPGGVVRVEHGRVRREVNNSGLANWSAFRESAAIECLIASGRVISAHPLADCKKGLVLEHPYISPATYMPEWSAGMLYAAAELTLDLSEALIDEGLGLKDATPYNVLFRGAQPVFIDVLSVEQRDPLDAIWRPLSEFQRTFLLPLAAWRDLRMTPQQSVGWRRDGIDLVEAVHWAGPVRRWLFPWRGLATLPAKFNKPAQAKGITIYQTRKASSPEEAKFILRRLFRRLRRQLKRLAPKMSSSTWTTYVDENTYSLEERQKKKAFVQKAIKEASRTLDIGANTGEYTLQAAQAGSEVVAIDRDAASIDRLWRTAQNSHLPIAAIVADIASMSGGAGWRGTEYCSLLSRLGQFDCVLMLALIHHLAIQARIPVTEILALGSLLGDWLVVEWVSVHDSQAQKLLRGREAPVELVDFQAFENCVNRYFLVEDTVLLKSTRKLLLLKRKPF